MKLSPAQAALLHTAESAASSALMTLVIGVWQALATGQVHWSQMAVVFGSGFVAALGLIYKSVKSSPALSQAESDTTKQVASEAHSLAMTALNHIDAIWPAIHNLNTQQASQKAATPVNAPQPVHPSGVSPSGFVAVAQGPASAVVNNPPVFSLPQRTFTQSALMPAVPKQ